MSDTCASGEDDLQLTGSQELYLDAARVGMTQLITITHLFALAGAGGVMHRLALDQLAVASFFMLSGFLIFTTTWRRRHSAYGFREFLIDRACRLGVCMVPALVFAALVAYTMMGRPGYPATSNSGLLQFLGNLLMLQDYPLFQILRRLGVDSAWFIRPYSSAEPFWTLPIELFLYVVFGFVFFYVWRRRVRPSAAVLALTAVATFAVLYHSATGFGQCLTLIWLLGCVGAWCTHADRRMQARFAWSDRAALLAIVGWMLLFLFLLALRIASRPLSFYDLQTALFVGCVLLGVVWLTGRIDIDRVPALSSLIRLLARQSYALYLTHNTVITLYVASLPHTFSAIELAFLLILCNVVAAVFYFLFDRHYRTVARWLRDGPRAAASLQSSAPGTRDPLNPT